MKPYVVVHVGMSLDGRLDWSPVGEGVYYALASHWDVGGMLSGSNTILAAEFPEEPSVMEVEGDWDQLLFIVDSLGRVGNWSAIRAQPYWRDAVALCSKATPEVYLERLRQNGVRYLIAGDEKVDLSTALKQIRERFGIGVLRVDSGGILIGALLRAGLVDEMSVVIGPGLVGGESPRSIYVAPDLSSGEGVIPLKLLAMEQVEGDTVWLRYSVGNQDRLKT